MWVIFVLYFVCGGMSLGWASSADPLPPLSHNAVEALGQLTHHLQNPNAADKEQAAQLIASMVYTGVGEKDHNYGFREKAAAADIDAVKRALEALGTAMTRFPNLEKYIYGQRGRAPRDLPKTHIETCTIFIHEALIKALETKMGKSGSIIGSEKDKILSQMITARQKSLASQINLLLDTSFRKVDQLIGQQPDPAIVKKLRQAKNIGLLYSITGLRKEGLREGLTDFQWESLKKVIISRFSELLRERVTEACDRTIERLDKAIIEMTVDTIIATQDDETVRAHVQEVGKYKILAPFIPGILKLSLLDLRVAKEDWIDYIKAAEELILLNQKASETPTLDENFISEKIRELEEKQSRSTVRALLDLSQETSKTPGIDGHYKVARWTVKCSNIDIKDQHIKHLFLVDLMKRRKELSEPQWEAFLGVIYEIIDTYISYDKAKNNSDKNIDKQEILQQHYIPAIFDLGKGLSGPQWNAFLEVLSRIDIINKDTQVKIDKAIEDTKTTPPSGVAKQDWVKAMEPWMPKNEKRKRK